jgi:predicted MFS family arabinose efflux permease
LFIMIPPIFCLMMKTPKEAAAMPTAIMAEGKKRFSIDNYVVRHLILYAIVGGVFSFYNGIANSFMLLLGEARHIENISLFFTVSSAVLLLIRIFVSRLTDKVSMNWLVNGALLVSILSLMLISKTYALSFVLVAAVLKALGQGIGQVVLQGEALKRAAPGYLGIAAGTIFMGNDLGNTLGPLIGGAVTDSLGYSAMFYVGIAAFAMAMVSFIVYQKKKASRNDQKQPVS